MSRQGNLTLCVLWADELRKAAKLIAAALDAAPADKQLTAQEQSTAAALLRDAVIATSIALHGADNDQAVLLLSDAAMAQSHMVDAATELADSRDPDALDKWRDQIGATVQFQPAFMTEQEKQRASLLQINVGDQGKLIDLVWGGVVWELQVQFAGGVVYRADACHFERVEG